MSYELHDIVVFHQGEQYQEVHIVTKTGSALALMDSMGQASTFLPAEGQGHITLHKKGTEGWHTYLQVYAEELLHWRRQVLDELRTASRTLREARIGGVK